MTAGAARVRATEGHLRAWVNTLCAPRTSALRIHWYNTTLSAPHFNYVLANSGRVLPPWVSVKHYEPPRTHASYHCNPMPALSTMRELFEPGTPLVSPLPVASRMICIIPTVNLPVDLFGALMLLIGRVLVNGLLMKSTNGIQTGNGIIHHTRQTSDCLSHSSISAVNMYIDSHSTFLTTRFLVPVIFGTSPSLLRTPLIRMPRKPRRIWGIQVTAVCVLEGDSLFARYYNDEHREISHTVTSLRPIMTIYTLYTALYEE